MNALAHVEIDLASLGTARLAAPRGGDFSVCLLHGFGASAQDLVPLSAEIGIARRWLFPHAPVPIRVAGTVHGRAWFPRRESELEKALFSGYFLSLRELEPDGLSEAAMEVRAFIDSQGIEWDRLVLGGFSQGAMVTAELLRQGLVTGNALPSAILLYSGALVAERWWREAERTLGAASAGDGGDGVVHPSVCAFHGRRDAVLAYAEGEALKEALVALGFPVEWNAFDGGHEIPRSAVRRSAEFLEAIIGGDPSA